MKHTAKALVLFFFICVTFSPVRVRAEAENRSTLDTSFPVMPSLEKAVEFWKKIFAQYSLSQLVFFDSLDMSNIYEVVEVGEGNRPQSYIDAERARIAAGHRVAIDRVKAQRGIKERMIGGLKRSGAYMQHVQQVFREKHLPTELGYLPLVESCFDVNAGSNVGATGMWQFMRTTGKRFRLRIDRAIDERKDPWESTRAAAELLDENYQALGNWPLALTAYNYGAGGLARAVAEIQSDNLVELIENYQNPSWGFAAKNFYAEFLAVLDIAKNLDQYFPGLELQPPVMIKEVQLQKASSVAYIARSNGLTARQFFGWNPALSPGIKTVPAGYRVKLPASRGTEPIEAPVVQVAQNNKARPQHNQPRVVRHRVRHGETIMQIARRYGSSVERILQANGIRKADLLQVGVTLLVPKL